MAPASATRNGVTAPTRADGLRNRHRILAAARELFAERSAADVQLEDVAAAAGVSRATLFRHIQSKDALIEEIYRERVQDVQHLVQDQIAAQATGWSGFALLVRTLARWMHEDRGLYEYSVKLYNEQPDDPRLASIGDALTVVISRAHQERAIVEDFDAPDLLPLLGFTLAAQTQRVDYYTELLLAGLARR